MNCLILYPEELTGSKALISGERRDLLMERHGLSEGIEISAGIFGGSLGKARVVSVSENLELEFKAQTEPPARLPVVLICGLCRPQTVKKVLQASILFGIQAIHFVMTESGQKSYLDSKVWEPSVLRREIELGLEQAVDTVAPEVKVHKTFHEFINDELSNLPLDEFSCVIADTQDDGLGEIELSAKPIVLAVGPESGWTAHEREVLLNKGFHTSSLGPRMLRVETAVSGFLGAIQAAKAINIQRFS